MQWCKTFMYLTIQKSKAQQLTWGLEAYQLLHASIGPLMELDHRP